MRSLIAFLIAITAGTSMATTFIYDINAIPAANPTPTECRQVANEILTEWLASDHIADATSLCVRVDRASYDIQIRYEAEFPIVPISTANAGSSLADPGFFADRATCEAVLPDEITAFTENTGLTPLYTPYCYSEDATFNNRPWMFRIEAIGNPAVEPQLEMAVLKGDVLGQSRDSLLEAMKNRLIDLGTDVRFMRYSPEIDLGFVNVFLYGEGPITFATESFGEMDSLESCEAELEQFKQAAIDTNHLALYCGTQLFRGPHLVGMFLDYVPFTQLTSVDAFSSHTACTGARASVVDQYRSDGLEVAAGLCELAADGTWRVNLLNPYDPLL